MSVAVSPPGGGTEASGSATRSSRGRGWLLRAALVRAAELLGPGDEGEAFDSAVVVEPVADRGEFGRREQAELL